MIEPRDEYKPFFYISSICLGAEVAYLLGFLTSPREGWAIYISLLVLAVSIPLLAGASVGAMLGYMKPMRNLLAPGLILFILWLDLLLLSVSLVACLLFVFVSLVSYKMLRYHYVDIQSGEN